MLPPCASFLARASAAGERFGEGAVAGSGAVALGVLAIAGDGLTAVVADGG